MLKKTKTTTTKKQEKIKLSFLLIYFYFFKLAWYVYRSIKVKTMLQQGKLQLIEICQIKIGTLCVGIYLKLIIH